MSSKKMVLGVSALMLVAALAVGFAWGVFVDDHHDGSGHAHQSHQAPDAASRDFVVVSRQMVHKAGMAYYHIYLKSDATESSYAQTMKFIAASEEDFKQVQVYFYDDRAAYEGDDKAAVGILSTPPAYCTSRGHGACRPQRLVRVAAGFGRGTVLLGLGMIAGEFYPVGRLMDRLEARARILFGSLERKHARLLGWSQLSISLTVGLATFNSCTCSTRSHSVARTPPAERPPPRRALSCGGRFVSFSATPRVPRKPAQRRHPSVEEFPLFF
jgi:hypothetical protein